MTTYLFYDLETSGLNPCFDQVLQFAAIRTDTDLNELERYQYYVTLNPDTMPSPEASLTHRIRLETCTQKGMNEYEAIRKIHHLFNTPGTISLGYNTLNFDDEFLRFSFYRNLLAPYTHQYANGCGRMDIYPITMAYFLYCPEALNWPKLNGKATLRLEHLSQANQLAEGPAHDALVDVCATLELARTLKAYSAQWEYLTGYFDKRTDQQRQRTLPPALDELPQGMMLLGKLGATHQYQAPVLGLGRHRYYKNQTLWLRLDTPELQQSKRNTITEHAYVINKKDGEPGLLLPPMKRYMDTLDQTRIQHTEANLKWLSEHHDIVSALKEYYLNFRYPSLPNVDIDAALYELDFPTRQEETLMHQFHQAAYQEKAETFEALPPPLLERAIRILGRHCPEYLPSPYHAEFARHIHAIYTDNPQEFIYDYRGRKHSTAQETLSRIHALRTQQQSDPEQNHLLKELETYILERIIHPHTPETPADC